MVASEAILGPLTTRLGQQETSKKQTMKNIAHLSDDLETKDFAFIDIHVFPSSGRGGEKTYRP